MFVLQNTPQEALVLPGLELTLSESESVVAKFDPLYERRLPGWVEVEARTRGVTLERGAGELLCEVSGADLLGSLPFSEKAKRDFVASAARMRKDAQALFAGVDLEKQKSWDFVFDLPMDSPLCF